MKSVLQSISSLILVFNLTNFSSFSATIDVQSNSAKIVYPESIKFELELTSSVEIESVELNFGTDVISCGESKSRAIPEDFEPTTNVSVEWEWVLRKSGALPPGTEIWWEWVLTDITGETYNTDRQTLSFINETDPWIQLESESIEIFYIDGTNYFASELAIAGETALDALFEITGVELEEAVRIYIYPNSELMQTATLFAPDWSGGLAFINYRTVLAGVSPDSLGWGREVVAHELTHVLIGVYSFSCVSGMPTWLTEGLAMYAESSVGSSNQSEYDRLQNAISNNSLFSVREISNIFSNDADLARQAYAQSLSVVDYLINNFGQEKMLKMLDAFRDGYTQDQALGQVYNFDQNSLDAAWREWVGAPENLGTPIPLTTPTRTPYPTIAPITGPIIEVTATQKFEPQVGTVTATQFVVEEEISEPEENINSNSLVYGLIPIIIFILGLLVFIIKKARTKY